MSHTMLHDANVEVRHLQDAKGSHAAITVNNEFEHVFPSHSRISEALGLMTEKELAHKLTGGSYFFIEDEMIDFRDGNYHGFCHDDKSIEALIDVIGYRDVNGARKSAHRLTNRTSSGTTSLSKIWNESNIELPMYQEGGDYSSQLSFQWNPFQKNITTQFELVRQICSNGMVGLTPFINMHIPLVNRWQEHLDIANVQLQHKIHTIMTKRLGEMADGRCTVADVMILEKHLMARLSESESTGEHIRLKNMYDVVDPFTHLVEYYKPEVFDNKSMAAQVPAHLSVFDAWNLATEICQHSQQASKSSDAGLQKLANALVFDRECATNRVQHIGKNIDLSPFSDPKRAFFGEVAVA